eukprot:376804-Pelagomonas_calceolata.AAC.4
MQGSGADKGQALRGGRRTLQAQVRRPCAVAFTEQQVDMHGRYEPGKATYFPASQINPGLIYAACSPVLQEAEVAQQSFVRLRREHEELLVRHKNLAYIVFAAIDEVYSTIHVCMYVRVKVVNGQSSGREHMRLPSLLEIFMLLGAAWISSHSLNNSSFGCSFSKSNTSCCGLLCSCPCRTKIQTTVIPVQLACVPRCCQELRSNAQREAMVDEHTATVCQLKDQIAALGKPQGECHPTVEIVCVSVLRCFVH